MHVELSVTSEHLDKEDLRALIQALRACETATFPDKEIIIRVVAPELSMADCDEIIRSINPPYKRGPFTFTRKP